jgi:hypothetical protein
MSEQSILDWLDPKYRVRVETLRAALSSPEGIDVIIDLLPDGYSDIRPWLEKQAARVNVLSDEELLAMALVMGIRRAKIPDSK